MDKGNALKKKKKKQLAINQNQRGASFISSPTWNFLPVVDHFHAVYLHICESRLVKGKDVADQAL